MRPAPSSRHGVPTVTEMRHWRIAHGPGLHRMWPTAQAASKNANALPLALQIGPDTCVVLVFSWAPTSSPFPVGPRQCHAMPCHVLDVSEACLLAAWESILTMGAGRVAAPHHVRAPKRVPPTYTHLRVWGLDVYLGRGVSRWHGDWAGRRTYIHAYRSACMGKFAAAALTRGHAIGISWGTVSSSLDSGASPAWNFHLVSVLSFALSRGWSKRGRYVHTAVP